MALVDLPGRFSPEDRIWMACSPKGGVISSEEKGSLTWQLFGIRRMSLVYGHNPESLSK